MFLKIFKHAFLRPLKSCLLLMGISLLCSVLGGLFYFWSKPIDWQNLRLLYRIGSLLQFFSKLLLFLQLVIIFISFNKTVATDEAYLTFTLPTSNKEQYWARFFAVAIWSLIVVLLYDLSNFLYSSLAQISGAKLYTFAFFSGIENFTDVINKIVSTISLLIIFLSIIAHFIFDILFYHVLARKFNGVIAWVILLGIIVVETLIFVGVFLSIFNYTYGRGPAGAWVSTPVLLGLFGIPGGLALYFGNKFIGKWLNVT